MSGSTSSVDLSIWPSKPSITLEDTDEGALNHALHVPKGDLADGSNRYSRSLCVGACKCSDETHLKEGLVSKLPSTVSEYLMT